MKKYLKASLIGVGIILLVLILTNPSPKDFEAFFPDSVSPRKTIRFRVSNYLIFSTYGYRVVEKKENLDEYSQEEFIVHDSGRYFAIFNNFY